MFTSKTLTNNFAKLVFLIFALIIHFVPLQTNAHPTDADRIHKTKAYIAFNYHKTYRYEHILAYGIGVTNYITDTIELSFDYKTASIYISEEGYLQPVIMKNYQQKFPILGVSAQKSQESSRFIDLGLKYYYNSFIVQADVRYSKKALALKVNHEYPSQYNKIKADVTNKFFGFKLSYKYYINELLYISPKLALATLGDTPEITLIDQKGDPNKNQYSSLLSSLIQPELALGINLISPNEVFSMKFEISGNYTYYSNILYAKSYNTNAYENCKYNTLKINTETPSCKNFNINTSFAIYFSVLYGCLEVTSINDSDKLTVSARLGVNF